MAITIVWEFLNALFSCLHALVQHVYTNVYQCFLSVISAFIRIKFAGFDNVFDSLLEQAATHFGLLTYVIEVCIETSFHDFFVSIEVGYGFT